MILFLLRVAYFGFMGIVAIAALHELRRIRLALEARATDESF